MTESKNDRLIAIYQNFVSEEIKNEQPVAQFPATGKIKPDARMGYVTSVQDARKKLEDLFNLNQNKES